MDIKFSLLQGYIVDSIHSALENLEMDAEKIVDTVAIHILEEIQKILQNEKHSDFEVVEEIVMLLEQSGINCGARHDFS